MTYFFVFYLSSNPICDLVLKLFSEGIDISFRLDGAIPSWYLNKVAVVVHSSTLGWAYMTTRWELQAKAYALVLRHLQFSF